MAEPSQLRHPVPLQDGAKWGMDDWDWDPQTCQAVPKGLGPLGSAAARQEPVQALPQVKDAPARGAMSEDATAGTSSDAAPTVPAPPKPAAPTPARPGYCQADGCGKNLSKLTFYHARNKICDVHIKADVFTRNGMSLRFCQRCGNAHDLNEFDGNKHSCRAQLEKHNARRRKRQAEAAAAAPKKEKAGKQQKNVGSAARKGADEEVEEPGATAADAGPPTRRSNRRRAAPSYSQLDGDADVEEEQAGAEQTQGGWALELASLPVVQLPSGPKDPQSAAAGPEDVLVDDLSAWLTSHLAEMDDLKGAAPLAGSFAPASPRESAGGVAPPLPEVADSFDLAVGLMHPLELICADLSPGLGALALPTAPKLTENAMLSTVSVKLFGCTPAELPDDLRSQLASWFSGNVASLDGYLRPGCVHLTVQATVEPEGPAGEAGAEEEAGEGAEEAAPAGGASLAGTKRRAPEGDGAGRALQGGLATGGVARLVEKMLASGDPLWRTKTLLVQTGTEVALVHGGKLQQAWDVEAGPARRAVPAVLDVQPMVLLAGDRGGADGKRRGGGAPAAVRLVAKGLNLLQDDCEVVCRLQGEYATVESAGCDECSCAAAVRACCRSPDATGEATSSKDWEARCCGCCVSKITSLGGEEAGAGATAGAAADAGQPSTSACCGGGAARPTTAPASVDAVAQQTVAVHVGGPLRPGVLHVDVLKRAYMAPRGGRVLVVDSPAVHEELLALAARAPAAAHAWVDALGVVYEWVGDSRKMAYSTVERAAARLLHEALGFGLLETAKTLHALLQGELIAAAAAVQLPRSRGPTDGLALLSQADQACRSATLLRAAKLGCVDGLTMVHRAVQSQNPEALDMVLGWGREAEAPWRCDAAGPRGLTPLHMAVLVKDPAAAARMVLTLVGGCEPGAPAWLEAATQDGQVPVDFAVRAGRTGLLGAFGGKNDAALGPIEEDEDEDEEEEDEDEEEDFPADAVAPSTPRRCRCTGDCPCARSAEPCASCASMDDEEEDDACCGGKDGTCCCCASSAGPAAAAPEPVAAAGGSCCGAKAAVKSCCQ